MPARIRAKCSRWPGEHHHLPASCQIISPHYHLPLVEIPKTPAGSASNAPATSDWQLDEATCQASWRGQPLGLTRREFALLHILQRHPGKIYPRSQLLDLAYADALDVSDRAIDSHVKNLRKKLRAVMGDEAECIRSVYGVGFAFDS